MKTSLGLLFFLLLSNNAWSDLRCQTTVISPGMTTEEVKAVCGEPREETEKEDVEFCSYNAYSNQKTCETVQVQTLIYKRPSRYIIEFRNDKVFKVELQIYGG